ncbi:restriction endonuclease subunit S, partial [Burkholderia ubonensis]|uniref:restriction endonuclease subunit S n=1 Tax=Burkholderia ubonensis TaxID=101571 RepID=UPI000B249227
MSDDAATTNRSLSTLGTPVDAKITARKDPAKPYVGLENIPSRGAHLTGWAHASASISTNTIFRAGDVLFGKLRPNLRKCIVAPFDGYCSTDILVLRSNEGVDPSFAGKVLRTEHVGAAAEKTAIGTKMPRTSWKHLSELKVFCPSFHEQSKIAQVLDTLDTAIGETEAIVAKLKALKQGLLHDLLTRGVDANGELRPPYAEAPHLYKPSPLGWIPKTWEPRGVLDVAPTDRQCILTGPFGADLGQADFKPDGVPVLRIGNVQAGFIDWTDTQFVTAEKANSLRKYRVLEGDLLFARQGATTGRNALADAMAGGALINYHIIR